MKQVGNASIVRERGTNRSRANTSNGSSGQQMLLNFDRPPEPDLPERPLKNDDPKSHFALRFAALLETDPGASFNNAAISRLAQEIFGFSAGFARDTYDAAEAGFNIYLNRAGIELRDSPAAIERLLTEQARLPIQARRDQHQIEFQQFSTPPAQAFLVVKAAALRAGMTVLEPSAGTGNIAALARLTGAVVDNGCVTIF